MKAAEDNGSLFGEVKKELMRNWPPCRKITRSRFESWKEEECSFEKEMRNEYKFRAVELLKQYNKTVSKAIKTELRIVIDNVEEYAKEFDCLKVKSDHIAKELKNCKYLSPEQAKEMHEFMFSGLDCHGPMFQFCVNIVTEKYKSEMAFLFCVFCQIQRVLLDNTQNLDEFKDQKSQRNRGKKVAADVGASLRGKLKSFLIPKNEKNLDIESATKQFFREFSSLVMKMIQGLSLKA